MKKQIYAIAIAFLFVHIAYSQFSTREYQFDNKFLKPIKFKTYKEKPLFIYATDRIGRYWKVLIPIEVENVNKSRFERFHFSNYINSVDYRKIQYNIDFLNDYSALDDETIRRYLFGMMNDQGKKNFFTNNKGEKSFEYWGGSNTTTEQQKEIFKKFTKSGIHQEIIKLYNKLLNENPYIKFKAVIRPLKDEGKVEVIIDEISARSGRDTNLGVYVTFKYPEENEVIRNLDTYNYLMNGGLDLKKPNSRKYLPYMYIIRTLKQPYKGTVFFDSNYQDKGKDFGQKDLYVNEYKYVESSIGIGDFKKWMADYDIDCEDLFNKTEDCEKQIEYIYNYYLKKEIFVPSFYLAKYGSQILDNCKKNNKIILYADPDIYDNDDKIIDINSVNKRYDESEVIDACKLFENLKNGNSLFFYKKRDIENYVWHYGFKTIDE